MPRPSLLILALLAPALSSIAFAADAASPAPDKAREKILAGIAKVYDTTVLHHIEVTIPAGDVSKLTRRTDERLHATFVFDGLKIENIGVRQAGGTAHGYKPYNQKPSLSIKFNEFTKGQDLYGLEKIVLKNELQDMSFVNEHMTYEVFRRAGVPAPMTAHAVVTINGALNGIYLMREPINKQFLTRNFGKEYNDGNLYEEDLIGHDFVFNPGGVDLKDEVEDKRSRADVIALAGAIRSATPRTFIATVGDKLDIGKYITHYAVESVTSHFDGFSFHNNNAYIYFNPKDGRMVVLPQGADEAFWATATPITRLRSPMQAPASGLARQLLAVPELREQLIKEIARVGSPPVWDQKLLMDRYLQVVKILESAERTGQTRTDLNRVAQWRPIVEAFIRAGGTSNGTARLPH